MLNVVSIEIFESFLNQLQKREEYDGHPTMNSNLWEARELALSRGGLVDGESRDKIVVVIGS